MDLLEPRTDFELQTFAPLFATHGSSQYFFSLGCGRMTCTSWCRAWLPWLLLSVIFFLIAVDIDPEVDDDFHLPGRSSYDARKNREQMGRSDPMISLVVLGNQCRKPTDLSSSGNSGL